MHADDWVMPTVDDERLDRLFGTARPGWSPPLSPANNRTTDDEEAS